MTTEDMIERFIDEGIRAYKKNYRSRSLYARKLDRHEPITIDGNEFTCWREYVCYKTAQHIMGILPFCDVAVDLDGNDTQIRLELTDSEQKKLNASLFSFLKKLEEMSA